MRIISFAWTTPAIYARRKTCTRRDWNDVYAARFQAGELVAGYNRSQRHGGHQIAIIRLTQKPYKERLCDVPDSDWEAEGFACLAEIGAKVNGLTPYDVWHTWGITKDIEWVIRFEIVELTSQGKFEHTGNREAALQCPLCFAEYLGEDKQ